MPTSLLASSRAARAVLAATVAVLLLAVCPRAADAAVAPDRSPVTDAVSGLVATTVAPVRTTVEATTAVVDQTVAPVRSAVETAVAETVGAAPGGPTDGAETTPVAQGARRAVARVRRAVHRTAAQAPVRRVVAPVDSVGLDGDVRYDVVAVPDAPSGDAAPDVQREAKRASREAARPVTPRRRATPTPTAVKDVRPARIVVGLHAAERAASMAVAANAEARRGSARRHAHPSEHRRAPRAADAPDTAVGDGTGSASPASASASASCCAPAAPAIDSAVAPTRAPSNCTVLRDPSPRMRPALVASGLERPG